VAAPHIAQLVLDGAHSIRAHTTHPNHHGWVDSGFFDSFVRFAHRFHNLCCSKLSGSALCSAHARAYATLSDRFKFNRFKALFKTFPNASLTRLPTGVPRVAGWFGRTARRGSVACAAP